MNPDELKKVAAEKAVEQVKSGMVLGLGHGSTATFAVAKIGQLWQNGTLTDIVAIPTSEQTAAQARKLGIPLGTLDQHPVLDLAIDGADEVDPQLNLIKGLGGALLREKMVEVAAKRFIVIVDKSKLVNKLGTRGPLPVEVVQFGWKAQARWLETLGCTPALRGGQPRPFVTDNGNYILDCTFPNGIGDPAALTAELQSRVGVVAHGLFLGMATEVLVGQADGVRSIKK